MCSTYCAHTIIKPNPIPNIKSKIVQSKESLNTYISYVVKKSIEILKNNDGLLIITPSRDKNHSISCSEFTDFNVAKGTNIPKAVKEKIQIELDRNKMIKEFDVIPHNSAQSIGSNQYADFTNIFITSRYFKNPHAILKFNKSSKCQTTKLDWQVRSNIQSIGRVGRNKQKIKVYFLGSEKNYSSTVRIIRKLENSSINSLRSNILSDIHKLLNKYPDFIVNKTLDIPLQEIFEIVPRSERKRKEYRNLVLKLETLGVNLNIT